MKNEKKIILCIDDRFDKPYVDSDEGTLEARLRAIYKGTEDKYDLEFVKTFDGYNKILSGKAGKQIALVLLDHELNFKQGRIQGPWIAKDLYSAKMRKDIRIIGLTVVGRKESTFGHQSNVVEFISKNELQAKSDYLRNISVSIIDDYFNQKWEVLWDITKGELNLRKGADSYSCPIGGKDIADVLTWCLKAPGQWIGPLWHKNLAGKVTDEINRAVRGKTTGRVWGIITTEESPLKCVKVLVNPNPKISYSQPPYPLDKYTLAYTDKLRGLEELMRGIAARLEALEKICRTQTDDKDDKKIRSVIECCVERSDLDSDSKRLDAEIMRKDRLLDKYKKISVKS